VALGIFSTAAVQAKNNAAMGIPGLKGLGIGGCSNIIKGKGGFRGNGNVMGKYVIF
jgi:hypothetical protein